MTIVSANNFLLRIFIPTLIVLFCATAAFGQHGYSSASMAMGKQQSLQRIIPRPEHIVTPEYINYHKHNIPLPGINESVHLDLRWDNTIENREMILQVGITTGESNGYFDREPSNVCLVIDRSGSMSGIKMQRTKEAMLTFLGHLQAEDLLSIVVFDHEAAVLRAPVPVGDKYLAEQIIRNIQVRGSTDLNAGIVTGYRQLVNQFQQGRTNRMIILTDAMTNSGTIDPEQIIKNAGTYEAGYDVDFTFIGVGMDINADLARQLSESKHSTFHFIHDAADINKVFNAEVESLLAKVAGNVEMTIRHAKNIAFKGAYGQPFSALENEIHFRLNDFNGGLTQVVLASFLRENTSGEVTVTLAYDDMRSGKRVFQTNTINSPAVNTRDREVQKNVTIARMAVALHTMAELYHQQRSGEAQYTLKYAINQARESGYAGDPDVDRVLKILENYAGDLLEIVRKD